MTQIMAVELGLKEIGAAAVEASLKKLGRTMNQTADDARNTDNALGGLAAAGKKLIAGLAVGAVFKKFIDATSEAEFAQAQLRAGLESTGYASGQTLKSLNEHAEALSRLSTFDDDAIAGAQKILLTFTQIGGDVFPEATKAVVDLATKMEGDLQGAAIQIGKALQDPENGITALSKAGVSFSASQKEVIKRFVETNRLADAQKMVLRELGVEFGGSAEAARKTLGGAIQGLKHDFDNLFEIDTRNTAGIVRAINAISELIAPLSEKVNQAVSGLQGLWTWFKSTSEIAGTAVERAGRTAVTIATNVGGAVTAVGAMPFGKSGEVTTWLDNFNRQANATDRRLADSQEAWRDWRYAVLGELNLVKEGAAQPGATPTPPPPPRGRRDNAGGDNKGKTRNQLLVEYNAILDYNRRDIEALSGIEKTLTAQLERGNISLQQKINLTGELHRVQALLVNEEGQRPVFAPRAQTEALRSVQERFFSSVRRLQDETDNRLANSTLFAKILKEQIDKDVAAVEKSLSDLKIDVDLGAVILSSAAFTALQTELPQMIVQAIASGIADGLTSGFEAAFSGGGLSGGFEALTASLLGGLGSMLISFGTASLLASKQMMAIKASLAALDPTTSAAAAIGMIALGAALKGAAQAAFGGGAGGGGGGSYGRFTGGGMSAIPTAQLIFGATSATTAAGMSPRAANMTFNVIGPRDPQAQRTIQELLNKANSRGTVGG